MKKLLLIALLLTGCESRWDTVPNTAKEGSSAKSILLTEIEGCRIYTVNVQTVNPVLYLAKCKDSATVEYATGGKFSTHIPTITYNGE